MMGYNLGYISTSGKKVLTVKCVVTRFFSGRTVANLVMLWYQNICEEVHPSSISMMEN